MKQVSVRYLRLLSHGHSRRPCGGQTASRAWGRGRDAEGDRYGHFEVLVGAKP